MKKTFFLAIAFLSLVSCQKEDLMSDGMYSDKFMSSLKFKTLKNSTSHDGTEPESNSSDNVLTRGGGVNIGIFSVRLARPSTDCKDGFGFCDFVWFPKNKSVDMNNPLYDNSFLIKSDENGNKFVDMELLEKPDKIDVSKLQPLVVEEELESFRTIEGKEKEMVVPVGKYYFVRSVGQNGGYRIPLK